MSGLHFRYADVPESAAKVPPGDRFLFKEASCEGGEGSILECDIGSLYDTADCDLGLTHPCVLRDDVFLHCTNWPQLPLETQNRLDHNTTSSKQSPLVLNTPCFLVVFFSTL